MLYLDDTTRKIKDARSAHLKAVNCFIGKRAFNVICGVAGCQVCAEDITYLPGLPQALLDRLADPVSLNEIIVGKPLHLIRISNELWDELVPHFSWTSFDDYRKARRKKADKRNAAERQLVTSYDPAMVALKGTFDYANWFNNGADKKRYDAYGLAFLLDRNTCTYCNRIYTNTMKDKKNGKVMRPQFDHWFAKSKHPALALSFYNLIPSCSVCNSSIKGTLEFELGTHLHPYVDADCQNTFQYSYDYSRSLQQYHIKVKTGYAAVKVETTLRDLKLKEVYNAHYAELDDLIKTKEAYTTKYISNMLSNYPGARLSFKEVYRLAFGAEFDEADFHKKPLSKFKKDILRELKLIP